MPRATTSASERSDDGHDRRRPARSQRRDEADGGDRSPHDGFGVPRREHGEGGDADEAADEVELVGVEVAQPGERPGDAVTETRHHGGDGDEHDGEDHPTRRPRRVEAEEDEVTAGDADPHVQEAGEHDEGGQRRRRSDVQRRPATTRPQEPDADPEEAAEQHDVGEVRQVQDVRSEPADQRQLDEQGQEGGEDELGARMHARPTIAHHERRTLPVVSSRLAVAVRRAVALVASLQSMRMSLGTDRDVARLAIGLVDLTDLGDDTSADAAEALCQRARDAGVAGVCVWPAYVSVCVDALAGTDIRVATVVNFPSGEEPSDDVMATTQIALDDGADEIDVVLPYRSWLRGDEAAAARVVDGVRELVTERADRSAGPASSRSSSSPGELPDQAAIDRATHFAITHGADFVKTSTGKTPVSATPEAAEIILEAIELCGLPVGLKASGGIRTLDDARTYLELAERIMGDGWISPDTFRFGASGVLDALVAAAGEA